MKRIVSGVLFVLCLSGGVHAGDVMIFQTEDGNEVECNTVEAALEAGDAQHCRAMLIAVPGVINQLMQNAGVDVMAATADGFYIQRAKIDHDLRRCESVICDILFSMHEAKIAGQAIDMYVLSDCINFARDLVAIDGLMSFVYLSIVPKILMDAYNTGYAPNPAIASAMIADVTSAYQKATGDIDYIVVVVALKSFGQAGSNARGEAVESLIALRDISINYPVYFAPFGRDISSVDREEAILELTDPELIPELIIA